MPTTATCRNLVIVLGDQLNEDSAAFDDFDQGQDVVWMAEVDEESTHVWSHKARIVMFLSAMRHFRDRLHKQGMTVDYHELGKRGVQQTLGEELRRAVKRLKPERLIVVQPGEWRIYEELKQTAKTSNRELEIRTDRHFLSTLEEFAEHAQGRRQLRLEYFYREIRRKHGVLMSGDQPEGGQWNYDQENRDKFGQDGPEDIPAPISFPPDEVTAEVIELVERRFAEHPGELANFDWPLTPTQAQQALRDFIQYRLPRFGDYQDAMWTDEPFLYHSLLSAALNLKLLDPREVVQKAVDAYERGEVPLNCVEGFVRQIIGWREYVRGIYWLYMPDYGERNFFKADQPLPDFYWTGETEMNCLSNSIRQTLEYGYAHHIQRLMVTGLFALLLGVNPKAVHQWYLAVYVDAVEWVELPNTLGMSQFADGGVMASKPYIATGKYIQRMSNYCSGCRFHPEQATGEDACPFTTLYWDFLAKHQKKLSGIQRMGFQLKNLDRKSRAEIAEIQAHAKTIRKRLS